MDPQLERRDCRVASWEREGAVGSEALISAVSCDTVLPTSLMIPALLVCWRIMAFTWLEAEDTLEKVCTITVPIVKLLLSLHLLLLAWAV